MSPFLRFLAAAENLANQGHEERSKSKRSTKSCKKRIW